jgi:uncharacterized protein (TIGR00255 family)
MDAMTLKSMTGFSRAAGGHGAWRWTWEIKTVNSKNLDLRLRLPPQFDAIDIEARARFGRRLARGACQASLSAQRDAAPSEVRINRTALRQLVDVVAALPAPAAIGPATMDGLLALRGVVDIVDAADDEAELAACHAGALADLDLALDDLVAVREREGAALASVLGSRVERIAALTRAADECPARRPEAVKARLSRAVAVLLDNAAGLDPARLHQEALLLAAKADIREELDRLQAHVAAARSLLASGAPVGRKLDFLAQEFGREANTLCAKANDAALTAIGMDLRVEIEQFREQAQNIE